MIRTIVSRMSAALLIGGAALVAGCNDGDLAGPTRIVGDPLLDIQLGPGAPVYPGATVTTKTAGDTMFVTLTNLPPLPSDAVYQVFLVDSTAATTPNMVPVSGALVRTRTTYRPVNRDSSAVTTTTDTTASASTITTDPSFQNARTMVSETFRLIVTGVPFTAYTHVVVGVSSPAVTAPTTLDAATRRGFLWRRYRTGATTYSNGSLTFGSFAINSANRLNYAVAGNYDGAFRGDQLILNLRQLVRPPEGFQYAVWLFNFRAGTFERVGVLTTPPPMYDAAVMRNADVAPASASNFLAPGYIVEATIRAPVDSSFTFEQVSVVLEPKGTADVPDYPSMIVVVNGLVPPSVTSRLPGNGKLYGKLTGPPASINTATVYLTSGSTIPVLVTTSDSDGDFFFRSVTPGAYTVNVVPSFASSPTATQSVVVTRTAVGSGFVGDSVFVTIAVP